MYIKEEYIEDRVTRIADYVLESGVTMRQAASKFGTSKSTVHTAVMALRLSSESAPLAAASIMPSSSLTGIKVPDSSPTYDEVFLRPF